MDNEHTKEVTKRKVESRKQPFFRKCVNMRLEIRGSGFTYMLELKLSGCPHE